MEFFRWTETRCFSRYSWMHLKVCGISSEKNFDILYREFFSGRGAVIRHTPGVTFRILKDYTCVLNLDYRDSWHTCSIFPASHSWHQHRLPSIPLLTPTPHFWSTLPGPSTRHQQLTDYFLSWHPTHRHIFKSLHMSNLMHHLIVVLIIVLIYLTPDRLLPGHSPHMSFLPPLFPTLDVSRYSVNLYISVTSNLGRKNASVKPFFSVVNIHYSNYY